MPSKGTSPELVAVQEGTPIPSHLPDLPPAASAKRELVALAILALAVVGVLGVLPSLATADLNWCYPYMSPDSWDWLANGLHWSGVAIPASYRPPGLPLVMALLHRLQALPLLPYLNFAMLGLAAVLLHRLIRLRHSALVAALAVLLFVSNGSLFGYTRFIMAEVWTLPFLVGAAIAFARAATEPRRYVACAFLLSLSFLFHYAGLVVGIAFALAVLLHRREALRTRWPALALFAAVPLPAVWLVLRALHNRSSTQIHTIERLVQPSFDNLRYYAVVSAALLGIVLLPLYLTGFVRLLPSRRGPLSPWAQAVVYPLVALSVFFTLIYHWYDKRFLYYLFPFAVAAAAEGLALLVRFARGSRWRTVGVTLALALMLLWNRIPYPATTHRLLALSPRDFVDLTDGRKPAEWVVTGSEVSPTLLATDGFLAFGARPGGCMRGSEHDATPALRAYLATLLAPAEPIGLASATQDPGAYWSESNRLSIALERPVVKPEETRYVVRHPATSDPRALATFGPFELFDRQALSGAPQAPPRPKHKRHRKAAD